MQRTHALSCPHGMCVVLNMNMSLVTCCDLSLSVFSVVLNSFSVLSARYAVWRLRGIKKSIRASRNQERRAISAIRRRHGATHALRRATYPQHIAKSAIDKTVRCHAPCAPPLSEPTHISSFPLNPSRPLTASRITVSPSSPKPLARKSILFSTPLTARAPPIAFAPLSPILL